MGLGFRLFITKPISAYLQLIFLLRHFFTGNIWGNNMKVFPSQEHMKTCLIKIQTPNLCIVRPEFCDSCLLHQHLPKGEMWAFSEFCSSKTIFLKKNLSLNPKTLKTRSNEIWNIFFCKLSQLPVSITGRNLCSEAVWPQLLIVGLLHLCP